MLTTPPTTTDIRSWWRAVDAIPGWLSIGDALLFLAAGELTKEGTGLLEIGAFMGRSAAVLGSVRQPGETFTVVDPFGDAAASKVVRDEQDRWYKGLAQERFEANYRTMHSELPTIRRCFSTDLEASDLPAELRIVHVDGAHDYATVRDDIDLVLKVAAQRSIIVFDDMRTWHTPGVTAAVWEAVLQRRLAPLVLTNKLWACPPSFYEEAFAWYSFYLLRQGWTIDTDQLFIGEFEIIDNPKTPITGHPFTRRPVAKDLAPPLLWRGARNLRERYRGR